MLIAATPITTAIMLIRISRAIETAEGDKSIECLIFNVVKATACLTPTSEMSILPSFSSNASRVTLQRATHPYPLLSSLPYFGSRDAVAES